MEPLSRDRFVAGALTPAAWYAKAQRVRAWYRDRVREVFADHDVLIAAATPCAATPVGAEWLDLAASACRCARAWALLTQPISCIGLPVVAAPMPRHGALPIGVQIIAAPWREDLCFRVAAALAAVRRRLRAAAGAPRLNRPPCSRSTARTSSPKCAPRLRALRAGAGRQRRGGARRALLAQRKHAALRRDREPLRLTRRSPPSARRARRRASRGPWRARASRRSAPTSPRRTSSSSGVAPVARAAEPDVGALPEGGASSPRT